MSTDVRMLDVAEYDTWDRFVSESPQGTLFHKSSWLAASGEPVAIYGYFVDQKLRAGLPVVRKRGFAGVGVAGHPWLTPYLGPIFSPNQAKYVKRLAVEKKIGRALASQIASDFHVAKLKFSPGVADLQPFLWEGFSSGVRYTYILDISNLDDAWQRMDDKCRNDIRRSEKDGVHIIPADSFDQVLTLVEKTFERQGQQAAFRAVAASYNRLLEQKKQCQGFLAKNADAKLIAVVYIVWDEKRSYYLLGGYDSENSHHGASAAAMWQAIKFTKEQLGLQEFDFEGSMIEPVEQFFRGFGGRLTPYFSVHYDRRTLIQKSLMGIRAAAGKMIRSLGLRNG
jgi:hypothetical protein